ncbi:MAG: Hint domain-containing protein [Rhodospirillales bacterium]|nr:Hint domain-containing protein [Rhodospirillales bacterium]
MTQTLAGTIAGPITLAEASATILAGAFVYWSQAYVGGSAVVAPVGVVSTVANAGTIAAAIGYGIEIGAGTFVNAAGGAVLASLGAVDNLAAGGALSVVNQGRIDGAASGVLLNHPGFITNAAGALLAGGAVGVSLAAAGAIVDNAGTISSYTIGVAGVGGDAVTNRAGASIDGGAGGVLGAALLDNAGDVTASGAGGTGAAAATILNRAGGSVGGATAAVAGTLDNAGTLYGTALGALATTLTNSGQVLVAGGGIGSGQGGVGVLLAAGATLANMAGGLVSGSAPASVAVQLAGGLVTNAGTLAAAYGVAGSGTLVDAGTIIGRSGTAVAFRPSLAASLLVLEPGAVLAGGIDGGGAATLELGAGTGTLSGFGASIVDLRAVTLDPGAAWLLAGSGAGLAAQPVAGLGAATLELAGTVESYVALSGGRLTLSGGTTLDLPGLPGVHVGTDGLDTLITACLAAGSRIATARGPVAIEALAVGERVVTASGRLAPVLWLGRRALDLARHARPEAVLPVRIRAGAFAPGVPERDLLLSPDHAVLLGGALVPVRHLVNGVSIARERCASVVYWHLELDRHDVVLAEGLACETYLDTGNRAAFAGEPVLALHPEGAARHARAVWAARGCAAILDDPTALALRARHTALLARTTLPQFRRAAAAATLVA